MPRKKRGRKPSESEHEQCEFTLPDPPEDIGQYGLQYWNELGPQLIAHSILKPIHIDSFLVLCKLWQQYRHFSEYLDEDPKRYTFQTQTGYRSESPEVRMRDNALKQMQSLWLKFGLTPHALGQLKNRGGGSSEPKDPVGQFAKKKYAKKDSDA